MFIMFVYYFVRHNNKLYNYVVSDKAISVLKGDVKLQLTNV